MNCTIDASVFVAAARVEEEHYAASRRFLQQVQALGVTVFCPTLVLAECAAAIARPTGDEALAGELVMLIQDFPAMRLVAIELSLANRAAQIAMGHRLRGADSIYAATAESCKATLVTWDEEMLDRCRAFIPTFTPIMWLVQQDKG
jgi:predicted nucleic acid-binding protein